jgi:hypothetical protein
MGTLHDFQRTRWYSGNAPDLFSGDAQPEHRLLRLRFYVIFLSASSLERYFYTNLPGVLMMWCL